VRKYDIEIDEKVKEMDEFEFINSIKSKTYIQPSLQKGIGDDAAVFRVHSEDVVTAVDTFVEDIHFSSKTTLPYHIGYRALAANISDVAAMGAKPTFYLVSIVIPKSVDDSFMQELFRGMRELANAFHIDLIGGDTVSGNHLSISVTIIGTVADGKVRYRHVATEDDIIFVTGNLGDSRAGLEILLQDIEIDNKEYFIRRHRMPEPRVAFALSLKSLSRVALNDVSDGIANELREIAEASHVDIVIEDEKVPVHPSLKQFSKEQQYQWKLSGGEDFELIGAVSPIHWDIVQAQAKRLELKVTSIGVAHKTQGIEPEVYIKQNGTTQPLLKNGYVHLK